MGVCNCSGYPFVLAYRTAKRKSFGQFTPRLAKIGSGAFQQLNSSSPSAATFGNWLGCGPLQFVHLVGLWLLSQPKNQQTNKGRHVGFSGNISRVLLDTFIFVLGFPFTWPTKETERKTHVFQILFHSWSTSTLNPPFA